MNGCVLDHHYQTNLPFIDITILKRLSDFLQEHKNHLLVMKNKAAIKVFSCLCTKHQNLIAFFKSA